MRTSRSLTVCRSLLPGRGLLPGGGCVLPGGWCVLLGGGGVLPREGVLSGGGVFQGVVSQHALRQTPPPCEQNETGVKILPWPQLRCGNNLNGRKLNHFSPSAETVCVFGEFLLESVVKSIVITIPICFESSYSFYENKSVI